MAKKKSSPKRRYAVRTKSYSHRTKSNGGGGKFGGIFSGLIAGAGGTFLRGMSFVKGKYDNYAQPAADLVTGHFMKERTLTVIGARALGAALVNQVSPLTAPTGGYSPLQ